MKKGGDVKVMLHKKTVVFSLRIPHDTDRRIKEQAALQGISQNAFIMNSINRELDKARLIGAKQEAKA